MPSLLLHILFLVFLLSGCGVSPPGPKPKPPQPQPGEPVNPAPSGLETDPGKNPARPPVASPISLLDGLPENARPKNTSDRIRLDRANDWLEKNAVGKWIEWDYAIGGIDLVRQEKTRYYAVSIYPGYDAQKRWNIHHLHGLDWTLQIGSEGNNYIYLRDVLDDRADQLTPLKGRIVKLKAQIESARLQDGTLGIRARNFTFDGVKTGLLAALDELASAKPAERAAKLEAILHQAGRDGAPAPAILSAIVPLLADQDPAVKQAAALAILCFDATHAAALKLVPEKASISGKYRKLLRVLYVPEVRASYPAEITDSGKSNAYPDYQGYKNVPAGMWTYIFPYWFVWAEETPK